MVGWCGGNIKMVGVDNTYMKPGYGDSLQLEVVTGETGDCSGQVRRLKDSGLGLGLVITTNLNNNWNISVFMFQRPVIQLAITHYIYLTSLKIALFIINY